MSVAVGRFTKRPVTIEAIQYPGLLEPVKRGQVLDWLDDNGVEYTNPGELIIVTLVGEQLVRPNWWIIKDDQGQFFTCSPEIFEAYYEQPA